MNQTPPTPDQLKDLGKTFEKIFGGKPSKLKSTRGGGAADVELDAQKQAYIKQKIQQRKQSLIGQILKQKPTLKKTGITRNLNDRIKKLKPVLQNEFYTKKQIKYDLPFTQFLKPPQKVSLNLRLKKLGVKNISPVKQRSQSEEKNKWIQQKLKTRRPELQQQVKRENPDLKKTGITRRVNKKLKTIRSQIQNQYEQRQKDTKMPALPELEGLKKIQQVQKQVQKKPAFQPRKRKASPKTKASAPKKIRREHPGGAAAASQSEQQQQQQQQRGLDLRNMLKFLKKMGYDPKRRYTSSSDSQSGDQAMPARKRPAPPR